MANKRKKEKGSKLLSLLRYLVPTAVLFIYIICPVIALKLLLSIGSAVFLCST